MTPILARFTLWRLRRFLRRHPDVPVARLIMGDVIAGCLGDFLRRVLE